MRIRPQTGSREQGFTLVELMMVLVVLAVLTAIIIPRISSLAAEARYSAGETALRSVYNGLERFKVLYGRYPDLDTDGNIGDSEHSFDEVIENFNGELDGFLGEWTYGGEEGEAGGYSYNNAGTYSLTIKHEKDSGLKQLRLDQTGRITVVE